MSHHRRDKQTKRNLKSINISIWSNKKKKSFPLSLPLWLMPLLLIAYRFTRNSNYWLHLYIKWLIRCAVSYCKLQVAYAWLHKIHDFRFVITRQLSHIFQHSNYKVAYEDRHAICLNKTTWEQPQIMYRRRNRCNPKSQLKWRIYYRVAYIRSLIVNWLAKVINVDATTI